MIIDNELKNKIIEIEKSKKSLLNNSNMDKLTMIESKEKEMEHASEDRKKILAKQIKEAREEIDENKEKISSKIEKEKVLSIKAHLSKKSESVKQIIESYNDELAEVNKKLNQLKSKLADASIEETLTLTNEMSGLCSLIIETQKNVERFEGIDSLISKALDNTSYDELLKAYLKIENIILGLNLIEHKDTLERNKNSEEEKIKKATELVEKLERDLTEENLKNAKEAVALLASGDVRNKLAERITVCEKKMEEEKLKSKEIDEIKKLLDEAEANKDLNKLNEARNRIIALPDGEEKRKLFDRANELNFVIRLEECENKVYNDEEIVYDSVKELTNIYSTLNDETKTKYNSRLNKLIAQHNANDQWAYQNEVMNDKPKKYNFFEKFSEFLSGVVWNKVISSKLYSKLISKKLKKAEEKNNDKKIEKNKNKLGKIGIVNGCKLFMSRNKIAKLKPALFDYFNEPPKDDDELEDYNKTNKKYSKAVKIATNKVSKELTKYSQKEHIMQNKDAVTNMIKQYLDILSMTCELDDSYNETIEFINNAKTAGIIDECEAAAYCFEANSIYSFRNVDGTPSYEASSSELDNAVTYYDSEPISRSLIYLKNTGSNNN